MRVWDAFPLIKDLWGSKVVGSLVSTNRFASISVSKQIQRSRFEERDRSVNILRGVLLPMNH